MDLHLHLQVRQVYGPTACMGIIDGVGGKVGDRGYHSLIDNVKDRQIQDEHFQDFFDLAMDEIHE